MMTFALLLWYTRNHFHKFVNSRFTILSSFFFSPPFLTSSLFFPGPIFFAILIFFSSACDPDQGRACSFYPCVHSTRPGLLVRLRHNVVVEVYFNHPPHHLPFSSTTSSLPGDFWTDRCTTSRIKKVTFFIGIFNKYEPKFRLRKARQKLPFGHNPTQFNN